MLGLIVLLQALTLAVSGPATSPEYLPIWIAAADGHFDRQRLKVSIRTTRSEVGAAEALAQGQADLVATSLEALLRFGTRERQSPRLLVGLTAAPPVLARARLTPTQVHIVSVGAQGLERSLAAGEVHAALLPEPAASRLLTAGTVTLLADLRTPAAARQTLGAATVSAGVFVRADRRPGERELAAFTRALLAAEARLAAGRPEDLAALLPRHGGTARRDRGLPRRPAAAAGARARPAPADRPRQDQADPMSGTPAAERSRAVSGSGRPITLV